MSLESFTSALCQIEVVEIVDLQIAYTFIDFVVHDALLVIEVSNLEYG